MSMSLDFSVQQHIDAKCSSKGNGKGFLDDEIRVGDYYININDMNGLIMYYLTNTDLDNNDVRIELVDRIKNLHIVPGYNANNNRFEEKSITEYLSKNPMRIV